MSLSVYVPCVDYRTALMTLRAHRIDLNLLFDHNPAHFVQVCWLCVPTDGGDGALSRISMRKNSFGKFLIQI